jgi:hypothetical protein
LNDINSIRNIALIKNNITWLKALDIKIRFEISVLPLGISGKWACGIGLPHIIILKYLGPFQNP